MKKKYLDYENDNVEFKFYCRVIKILAVGSYKRFMWLDIDGGVFVSVISDPFYQRLKSCGVPTCQSLRGKKNER